MTVTAGLRGDRISKVFPGGVRALEEVSFSVGPGRVLTLLGPSGCGKSTLLRIVAGLESATSGSLTLDGMPLDGVAPGRRDVGFVFQNYALYPHLTVERNLSLALEARTLPREEIRARVGEAARLLGLEGRLDRRPRQLSGGEQQRVALGRALVKRPRLYLMDEPLSNLDALLREGMRGELKLLFGKLGAPVLYVTHDQAEALSLSDEILVLRGGRALQTGTPDELYHRPADLFTATFVGSPRMAVLAGRLENGLFAGRGLRLALPEGRLAEEDVAVGIRPEDLQVAAGPAAGTVPARITLREPSGDRVLLTLRIGEETLRALAPPSGWPETVHVRVPPEKLHVFSAKTGKRLGEAVR